MNSSITDPQLQNWENFCRHHAIGDWHGTWSIYDLEGKLIRHFQCVRSFQVSADGNEVNHQNHYTYPDGTTKTETFGPHKKPIIKSLHFNDSFSWGSTEVKPETMFFFETGFKHGSQRRSAVARYNTDASLDIVIISEQLKSFAQEFSSLPINQLINWKGIVTEITPDWIISSAAETSWVQLEELAKDYLTLHLNDNVSISIPKQIDSNKELFLATEWLVNPTLLLRGIRYFDTFGFRNFTLEVFNRQL
ncbi:hypothetical protein CDG77_31090 [Nostoc sp. 'Peltigera membranacea cyanobiont' 213]|uniref:DUF3598 family protein n=1 Tax=Nostoc cyanobionts TaxID=3123326 RepID=UPI000B950691|nr:MULTISPECIES: DUF3598 family protein [unclassified Nostoc]OYD87126.1 hypothetical protein CDG77_31090 [Nostoc sp. 'Peltigera membranacea cyanobiont' 213]OYE00335.1 hypothetical protein CDG79_35760 [Nostoc sp. 'Peltigera membranacea cyanobiont' 232]